MTDHVFLVDSSIWIRLIRLSPAPVLLARIDSLLTSKRVAVNGQIRLEVLSGAPNEARFAQYDRTFGGLIQLSIRDDTWNRAARMGYELRRSGLTVNAPDLIIAASAVEHNAILIHADSDFDHIADHTDLRVESYTSTTL